MLCAVACVTTMAWMFWRTSAFNQDLSEWSPVNKVTDLAKLFLDATAFKQDLGWCLDNSKGDWGYMFFNTPCGNNARGDNPMDNGCGCIISSVLLTCPG